MMDQGMTEAQIKANEMKIRAMAEDMIQLKKAAYTHRDTIAVLEEEVMLLQVGRTNQMQIISEMQEGQKLLLDRFLELQQLAKKAMALIPEEGK